MSAPDSDVTWPHMSEEITPTASLSQQDRPATGTSSQHPNGSIGTSSHKTTRRQLLGASQALLLLAPGISAPDQNTDAELSSVVRHATRHIPDAQRIGEAIIATQSYGHMAPDLIHDAIRNTVVVCIDERIRQDYSMNQTMTVQGWVISKTEAALCVLLATRSSLTSAGNSPA